MAEQKLDPKGFDFEALRQKALSQQEGVIFRCAKDVKPKSVKWLWKHYLPLGKLVLLAGTKGDGKSTLAFSIASIVSCGGKLPDGMTVEKGKVLIWSGEDTVDDTIVPRLIAMGADLENIEFIEKKIDKEGKECVFDPSEDLELVKRRIATIEGGISLLILDPFVATVKRGKNSHNNAETRAGLQHVIDFIAECNCACIGIHHLTKNTKGNDPLDRVTGSLAFTAIPRIVLMTVTNSGESDGPPRMMLRAAINIGPNNGGGFGYDVKSAILHEPPIETSQIKWLAPIAGDVRDLFAKAEGTDGDEDRLSALEKACEFLRLMLADGPVSHNAILRDAKKEGHAEKTLRRAKKQMGIHSELITKADGKKEWIWDYADRAKM